MDQSYCAFGASCSIIDSVGIVGGSLIEGIGSTAVDLSFAAPWFWPLAAAIVGAILASLSGVIVDRLPAMRGWNGRGPSSVTLSYPPSHCDECEESIAKPYLVPILGWIWARGQCSHCGSQVPVKYPVIEGAVAVSSMAVVAVLGPSAAALGICFLIWAMLPIAWIDWNEHEIPDLLTVPLAALGLMFSPFEPDSTARVAGMVLSAMTMWAALKVAAQVKSVDTDAYGDVALCAAGGAWLGVCGVPACLLLAALSYVAYAIPTRKATGNDWVPMGPAIAAGVVVTALFGLRIV